MPKLAVLLLACGHLVYPLTAMADYGFNCAGLVAMTDGERQWYLRGYLLGLGQEVTIREAQLSSPQGLLSSSAEAEKAARETLLAGVRARRELWSKAARDNLGFEKSLMSFCRAPDNGWVGMFEAIPGAMYDMKSGGASEFPMREDIANEFRKQLH